jgi:hypothetical protein
MIDLGGVFQADPYNQNHGDHIVEIFDLTADSINSLAGQPLSDAMEFAAGQLVSLPANGSAQVYAKGLAQFAQRFREYGVSTEELMMYVRGLLKSDKEDPTIRVNKKEERSSQRAEVLKALMAGLADWRTVDKGEEPTRDPLDVGYLFDLGVAYMSAKTRGGGRAKVIADAAVSVTPLNAIPHRAESGRLAIQTLLEAMM